MSRQNRVYLQKISSNITYSWCFCFGFRLLYICAIYNVNIHFMWCIFWWAAHIFCNIHCLRWWWSKSIFIKSHKRSRILLVSRSLLNHSSIDIPSTKTYKEELYLLFIYLERLIKWKQATCTWMGKDRQSNTIINYFLIWCRDHRSLKFR